MAKMKKVLAIAMAAAMGMSMLAGCGQRRLLRRRLNRRRQRSRQGTS